MVSVFSCYAILIFKMNLYCDLSDHSSGHLCSNLSFYPSIQSFYPSIRILLQAYLNQSLIQPKEETDSRKEMLKGRSEAVDVEVAAHR